MIEQLDRDFLYSKHGPRSAHEWRLVRYLTRSELPGGGDGVCDIAGIQSAVVQPQMTFGGRELYPTIIDKAAALCFSLVMNHPFVDGNKRIGHAADF